MRSLRVAVAVGILAAAAPGVARAGTNPPSAPACPAFPADNVWNADVSALPVHPRSAQWLASSNAATTRLHPDFGPSGTSMPYGIPWVSVAGTHPRTAPSFTYASESDPGPYPFGADTPIEGGAAATGDRHAIMVDRDACRLYELYDAHYAASGSSAGSGAIWDLRSDALRPAGWTSADAAGLPIFPGLLRRDEVAAGSVTHAIRFTVARTDRSYIWPARHQAGAAADPSLPPMGARFRLKAGFDISHFRPDTQVVLRAMQHYGLMLADNGSNWYFQGAAEDGWDPAFLTELKSVPASQFEAVDESSLMISPDSAAVAGGAPGSPQSPGGYRLVASDGGVFCFGDSSFLGSTGAIALAAPVTAGAGDPGGYRMVARDGGVFTFGADRYLGSAAGRWPGVTAVAVVPADAGGYWVVAADGQIAAFGDAPPLTAGALSSPAVAAARTPTGRGLWIAAKNGSVATAGDAKAFGATAPPGLQAPIVAIAPTPSGSGYWLAAADGGIFTAGDAAFHGSTGAMHLNQPVVTMAATPSGGGYWLIASDGGVFSFGDAPFHGSTGAITLNRPIVGIAGVD